MWKIHKYIFIIILITNLTAGCTTDLPSTPNPETGVYSIDLRFEPLLDKLGDLKGVGISPSFIYDGVYYQYTTTVLLVYAPEAAPKDRYRLFPLANEWIPNEPAVGDPGNASLIYVNGHIVWNEVAPYYTRMGAAITGLPLTEVKFNPDKDRYEQWFENMGFYRNRDDAVGKLRLMPYGQWKCEAECAYRKVEDLNIRIIDRSIEGTLLGDAEARFIVLVSRLGIDFTGVQLTGVRQAPDGYIEQVFENLVMVWNPERPDTMVGLRLLPQSVGISPEPPVPPSTASGMYFHTITGDLGYNIPQQFMDYITMHGTLELSGAPITEARRIEEGVIRQCFERLCLIYDPNAPDALKIRPDDLGYKYNGQTAVAPPQSEEPKPESVGVVSQVKLSIWEEYPLLNPGDTQVLGAAIFDGTQPLSGILFAVAVDMPDGSQRMYQMPLTGENGQSMVVLDSYSAPKGTIVLYEVCVMNLSAQPICMEENFLIWGEE